MFIGHFAAAFVAARHRDAPSLPVLFVAAQLVDWAFFILLPLGVERMRVVPGFTQMNPFDLFHMPYTHSLVGTLAWAAAMGFVVRGVTRSSRAAWLAAAAVSSHWLLDWLVHAPDLTLHGAPPHFGLGLWNHPAVEMPLELALVFGAMAWMVAGRGGWNLRWVVLALVLLALQLVDWFGAKPMEVGLGMSALALSAYAVATATAAWAARKKQEAPRRGASSRGV